MAQIFISHAEEDARLVSNIADALDAEGYTTWHYKRDILLLSHLDQTLEAIRQSEAFMCLTSQKGNSYQRNYVPCYPFPFSKFDIHVISKTRWEKTFAS